MDPISSRTLLAAAGAGAPPVSPATWVGANIAENYYSSSSSTSITWPTGTTAGDLVIYVQHVFSFNEMLLTSGTPYNPWIPTGWTLLQNGLTANTFPQTYYGRRVFYKVVTSTDLASNFVIPSGLVNYYGGATSSVSENNLFTLRGHTYISGYNYQQIVQAGSSSPASLSVNKNGSMLAIASDRGATPGSFPSISPNANAEYYATAQYSAFSNRNLFEADYSAGTSYLFYDYSDTYPTSALMLVTG